MITMTITEMICIGLACIVLGVTIANIVHFIKHK